MLFEKKIMVKAPLKIVWDFLWDPEKLAGCIQGCQRAEVVEPQRLYTAYVKEKVGPFRVNFAIDLEVLAIKDLHIKAKAVGKDSIIAANMRQAIDLWVRDLGVEGTELDFKTDVTLFGKLTTLGHWIIKKKADEIMDKFVAGIKGQLE